MRRIPGTLLGLAVIASLTFVAASPVPKSVKAKWTEKRVREKLLGGCWYEAEKTVAGKPWPKHIFSPEGWKFTETGVETWELGSELSSGGYIGGLRIDVSTNPWRLDILSKNERGKVSVLPGVIRFDGDDILWATEFPGEGWYSEVDRAGEYKGRPRGFESTEANRLCVRRLKACEYLQTVFPKK